MKINMKPLFNAFEIYLLITSSLTLWYNMMIIVRIESSHTLFY